jgi:hypothetical protein
MSAIRIAQRLTSLASFEIGLRALLVLNLLDATATYFWVHTGLASEANPLMAGAISLGPSAFLLSKVALVGLAVLLLWRNREEHGARMALVPLSLLYAFVAGGHIGFALWKGLSVAPLALAMVPTP